MDVFSKKKRSWIMGRISGKDTRPEIAVRSLIHRMGYRYSLHRKDLPGHPDLVFVSRRKIVFVHGCFWHDHYCPRGGRIPKTNAEYWVKKKQRNKERDKRNQAKLRRKGWSVMIVWECELGNIAKLSNRIYRFLER